MHGRIPILLASGLAAYALSIPTLAWGNTNNSLAPPHVTVHGL